MAYDFKYVPTEGPISGISALEQTEIAINELGDFIESADSSAEEALEAAQNAQSTANDALNVAQDAITQVQEAKDDAAAATQAAQEATAAAGEASTKADTALDAAADAQTTANSATTTANNAQATANAATATAEGADTKADQALASANAITGLIGETQQLATKALGTYTSDDTEVDADALYADADKRYLTNTGVTNFPIPAPFYFDVMVNSDNTSVCQKVWSGNDARPKVTYIRLGTVTEDAETFDLSVSWGAWEQTGGGGPGGEPEYTTNTDAIDADTLFTEPSKIYSTNLDRTNFPASLNASAFLETNVSSTNSRTFQRAWSGDISFWDKNIYHRTAQRDGDAAIWGPWFSVGASSDVFRMQDGAVNANEEAIFPVKICITDGSSATNFPVAVSAASETSPWFFESFLCSDNTTGFQRVTQSYPNGVADPNGAPPYTYTRSRIRSDSSSGAAYTWGPWFSNAERQRIIVVDRKPLGTAGGSVTGPGGFQRDLNYVVENTLGSAATVTNNMVTVPPGTYSVRAWAPAYGTGRCSLTLRSSPDGAVLAASFFTSISPQQGVSSGYTTSTGAQLEINNLVVSSPGGQTFYLYQLAGSSQADNGAGFSGSWDLIGYEYYARIEFTRTA